MGLVNKKKDMTPFDMKRRPVKQSPLLMPLYYAAALFSTRGMKIKKIHMKGLKPPFLVYSTHQGFLDYFIVPRMLFPHRANYVSDMEGFAAYGIGPYRAGGCIGKRRYTADTAVISNVKYALNVLKQPVVIFPESRHCDAGITSSLPNNLGRLAKMLGVPLVIISSHGAYLANPFWDEEHSRKVRIESTAELVYTAEEIKAAEPDEIQRTVEEKLSYDEYAWQKKNGIRISGEKRAEGLHMPLYRCVCCRSKGYMTSSGKTIRCGICGAHWLLTEEGDLKDGTSGELISVPEWYMDEREEVFEAVKNGTYAGLDVPIYVEALPNEKGFVPLGAGRMTHNKDGFTLTLDQDEGITRDAFPLNITNRRLESVQTEYNYKKRGKCIVLSTGNCCYYVYSKDRSFIVTELEFAVEAYAKLRDKTNYTKKTIGSTGT